MGLSKEARDAGRRSKLGDRGAGDHTDHIHHPPDRLKGETDSGRREKGEHGVTLNTVIYVLLIILVVVVILALLGVV
jgi:hypothetical protein